MYIRYTATVLLGCAAVAVGTLATACSSSGSAPAAAGTSPTQTASAKTVAVTQEEDSNWAGYVVSSLTGNVDTTATTGSANGTGASSSGTGAAGSTGTLSSTRFSNVSGSWTQPAADCTPGSQTYSAFWVGLGGYTGQHLEQIGTSADCSTSGQATYSAWYELVPAAQVAVNMQVASGDTLSAHVAVSGTTVTLSLDDQTRHTTFSKQLTMSSPSLTSAEWIAEAPSQCGGSGGSDGSGGSSASNCQILPLANFGNVTFTSASVTANGQSGSIASGLGSVRALTLEANSGFGRMYAASAQADASVGTLSSSGSSFSVSYEQPTVTTPTPPIGQPGSLYH
jgi:hypothetical protein